MNKVNYLFDACVSHRNTLRIQHNLDDFFNEQEACYEEWYAKSHPSKLVYDEDEDEYVIPKTVLDNWDKIYDYPRETWESHMYERDIDIQLEPRTIQYDGYLYRWMSINEFNEYISHSLKDNTHDWSTTNGCSDNMGYCFIGKDCGYLNAWDLDLENEYLSYADGTYFCRGEDCIGEKLEHVGMITTNYMRLPGGNEFNPKVRTMDVFCKFYYKGEIRQCISYYGEGFFDEWEDNWMVEYGLKNYNDLELVDARFAVYDTGLCGFGAHKDEDFFKLK